MAVLGLPCCLSTFSSCSKQVLLFIGVRVLLIVVAFLVVEHGLQWLQHAGFSGLGALELRLSSCARLSCSAVCGIFPDQGLNPCLLHWPADS